GDRLRRRRAARGERARPARPRRRGRAGGPYRRDRGRRARRGARRVTRADDARLRVGVLVSGRGTNLQALLDAAARPGYPARVVLVVSDKEQAPALARARTGGVAAVWLNPKDFGDRAAYDAALGRTLDRPRVGLVCLAGF